MAQWSKSRQILSIFICRHIFVFISFPVFWLVDRKTRKVERKNSSALAQLAPLAAHYGTATLSAAVNILKHQVGGCGCGRNRHRFAVPTNSRLNVGAKVKTLQLKSWKTRQQKLGKGRFRPRKKIKTAWLSAATRNRGHAGGDPAPLHLPLVQEQAEFGRFF